MDPRRPRRVRALHRERILAIAVLAGALGALLAPPALVTRLGPLPKSSLLPSLPLPTLELPDSRQPPRCRRCRHCRRCNSPTGPNAPGAVGARAVASGAIALTPAEPSRDAPGSGAPSPGTPTPTASAGTLASPGPSPTPPPAAGAAPVTPSGPAAAGIGTGGGPRRLASRGSRIARTADRDPGARAASHRPRPDRRRRYLAPAHRSLARRPAGPLEGCCPPASLNGRSSRLAGTHAGTLGDVLSAIIFWGAGAVLAWVYLGYPFLVAILAGCSLAAPPTDPLRPCRSRSRSTTKQTIAERIADALAQAVAAASLRGPRRLRRLDRRDQPDRRRLAIGEPRIRLLALPRGGQTATQAALFRAATTDVVVLTDAETRFAPGCLARLAEAFRDPRVGCATGPARVARRGRDRDLVERGPLLALRAARARARKPGRLPHRGDRRLLAVRRSAYRPVPLTASMDHLLPLYVREAGRPSSTSPEPWPPTGRSAGCASNSESEPDRLARDPGQPVDGRAGSRRGADPCGTGHLVAQAPALGDALVRARRSRLPGCCSGSVARRSTLSRRRSWPPESCWPWSRTC